MWGSHLLVFVGGLFCASVLTRWVRDSAMRHGWIDSPGKGRHIHSRPVPRLGGVAIYFSFMAVVILAMVMPRLLGIGPLLPARAAFGLLGPALIVFLLGLFDDLHSVSPAWKLAIQALAAIWLYAGGYGIHNLGLIHGGHALSWVYCLPLTILWVLLITNAFNLIDGLDGLAAGSALFSTTIVFTISLFVPNPMLTLLTIALAGAILGFLRFNFHPATIFLGDSGSLFIGFMLSALALAGSQKAPTIVAVAIPVVSLGLPILDVALAVVRRFLGRKPLFAGDSHHIHHKLLKRGLSQREAVLMLYAVTAGFGFLSLALLQNRRTIALVLAVTAIGVVLGVQQLRYQEFAELLSVLQRITRRRQVLANHVAIRHASESLRACDEFRSICKVLREALEPVGFDGLRFKKLGRNGFPAASLYPLSYAPDGNLFFSWSANKMSEPPWELWMELLTSSREKWGYLSLFRRCDGNDLLLDPNMLTGEFRTALSDAVNRASTRLEAPGQDEGDERETRTHKLTAGSMAD